MNILETWKNKIIFGYYHHPAFIRPEREDAGFSVRLFANGTLLYQTYCLNVKCEPTILASGRATLYEVSVSRITRFLAGDAREIDALPEYTNNGSCDGAFYDFVFIRKIPLRYGGRKSHLGRFHQNCGCDQAGRRASVSSSPGGRK